MSLAWAGNESPPTQLGGAYYAAYMHIDLADRTVRRVPEDAPHGILNRAAQGMQVRLAPDHNGEIDMKPPLPVDPSGHARMAAPKHALDTPGLHRDNALLAQRLATDGFRQRIVLLAPRLCGQCTHRNTHFPVPRRCPKGPQACRFIRRVRYIRPCACRRGCACPAERTGVPAPRRRFRAWPACCRWSRGRPGCPGRIA